MLGCHPAVHSTCPSSTGGKDLYELLQRLSHVGNNKPQILIISPRAFIQLNINQPTPCLSGHIPPLPPSLLFFKGFYHHTCQSLPPHQDFFSSPHQSNPYQLSCHLVPGTLHASPTARMSSSWPARWWVSQIPIFSQTTPDSICNS